jgi:hypothetical protein
MAKIDQNCTAWQRLAGQEPTAWADASSGSAWRSRA